MTCKAKQGKMKNYTGNETLSLHQFRKRGHLGPKHCMSPERKQLKSVGIRRVTSGSPLLVLMVICCKSFLKSMSGTKKFISIMNRVSMKSHSKLSEDLDQDSSEAPL